MKSRAADFVDAINHLPDGATLTFSDVSWQDYEKLLDDFAERSHFRINYDRGRLEIVSPLPDHEAYARFIERLIQIVSEELSIPIQSYGTTTWRRQKRHNGAEPDCSYYVRNAASVIGKRTFDLDSDPPPDIVVEIDTSSRSLHKFPIYAGLEIPEVWQYNGTIVRFYKLSSLSYLEVEESRFIPSLKSAALSFALQQSKIEGQTAALSTFRASLRKP